MKYLSEQYRELLNEMNPLGSGMFVYEEVAKTDAAKTIEATPATLASNPEKKAEDPKEALDKAIKGLDTTMKTAEAKYKLDVLSPEELHALDSFKNKAADIRKDFDEKIKGVEKPDQAAMDAVKADVDALLAQINLDKASAEAGNVAKPQEKNAENTKEALVSLLVNISSDPARLKELLSALPGTDKKGEGPNGKLSNEQAQKIIDQMPVGPGAKLEKGEVPSTNDIAKAFLKNPDLARISEDDPAEKKIIEDTLTTKELDKAFGDAKSTILENISRVHEVKLGGKDGKEMFIDGGDKPVTDIKGLMGYLKPEIRAQIDQLNDPKAKKEELANIKKGLVEGLTSDNKTLAEIAKNKETVSKLMEAANAPKTAETVKPSEMGIGQTIGALVQLWESFQAAVKDGDWGSLNDMLSDFTVNPPTNPSDSMKLSRKAYTDALNGKKDLPADQLLDAYLKPRGPETDKLFLKEAPTAKDKEAQKMDPLNRYRAEAKPAISEYLQTNLGLTSIQGISKVGNRTMIDAFKEEKHISVEFYTVAGKLQAEILPFGTIKAKDGTDTVAKDKVGEKIAGINNAPVTLKQVNDKIAGQKTAEGGEKTVDTEYGAALKSMIKETNVQGLSPLGKLVKDLKLEDVKIVGDQKAIDTKRVDLILTKLNDPKEAAVKTTLDANAVFKKAKTDEAAKVAAKEAQKKTA